jgi:hypothetical protein
MITSLTAPIFGQFPIGEMGGKADRGLAAFHDGVEALLRMRRIGDDVFGLRAEAFDAELIQMREFNRDATKIIPHAAENGFDFGVRFFRKREPQILAAEPVLLEQRADLAHQRAGEIRHAPPVRVLDGPEQADGEGAGHLVEQRLETLPHQKRIKTGR